MACSPWNRIYSLTTGDLMKRNHNRKDSLNFELWRQTNLHTGIGSCAIIVNTRCNAPQAGETSSAHHRAHESSLRASIHPPHPSHTLCTGFLMKTVPSSCLLLQSIGSFLTGHSWTGLEQVMKTLEEIKAKQGSKVFYVLRRSWDHFLHFSPFQQAWI